MKTEPTNVRLTPETLEKIKHAAELSGWKAADIIRLSMTLGLQRIEAVNYQIDQLIYDGIAAKEAAQSHLKEHPKAQNTSKRKEA